MLAANAAPAPPMDHPRAVVPYRPPVTSALVGINVAVFVLMTLRGVSLTNPGTAQLVNWGANWGPLTLDGQPWRALTSNYVHIGIVHILLNMWCLWDLGRLAERIFGGLTLFLIYTLCGLAGRIACFWMHSMVFGAGRFGSDFRLSRSPDCGVIPGQASLPQARVTAHPAQPADVR